MRRVGSGGAGTRLRAGGIGIPNQGILATIAPGLAGPKLKETQVRFSQDNHIVPAATRSVRPGQHRLDHLSHREEHVVGLRNHGHLLRLLVSVPKLSAILR